LRKLFEDPLYICSVLQIELLIAENRNLKRAHEEQQATCDTLSADNAYLHHECNKLAQKVEIRYTQDHLLICTRANPKLMPPILLCWPMTSEANVDMAVEVEPSRQYSVKFRCRATDDSRGAV